MIGESFYDLPVYRLPEDAYVNNRDRYIDKLVRSAALPDTTQASMDRLRTAMEGHYYDRYGPWQFNEIVGHVRLHFLGGQIRGEYFGVLKKRLVLTRTKTLVYQTHKLALEVDIPDDANSLQILKTILEYVDDCREELPGRYLDDEWLRTVGPYVDWLSLWKSTW